MRTKNLAGGLLMTAMLSLAACGSNEYVVTGTERAAGADGTITVEELDGGNMLVNVSFENLPPPDRLGQGLTTYIVWFKPEGAAPAMAGALAYDADNRSGAMQATSPHAKLEVIISAEKAANATSPSEFVVAKRQIQAD
jgi:hypothetical protein